MAALRETLRHIAYSITNIETRKITYKLWRRGKRNGPNVYYPSLQIVEDVVLRLLARNAKQMNQSEVEGEPALTASFMQFRYPRCEVRKRDAKMKDGEPWTDILYCKYPVILLSSLLLFL